MFYTCRLIHQKPENQQMTAPSPRIIDAVMQTILGIDFGIPVTTDGIPIGSAYFGVFVSIHRTPRVPGGDHVHGCMGNMKQLQFDLMDLANATVDSAYNAMYKDDRRERFPPLITDPRAEVEIMFLLAPPRALTDAHAFDTATDGLLLTNMDTGRMTTYLPGVFTSDVPLSSIKHQLGKKAGTTGRNVMFSTYKTDRVKTTLIDWIPRTQPYFVIPFCKSISPVSQITDVRTTSVYDFCDYPVTPDPSDAQAVAMVKTPTPDMIATMQQRLRVLLRAHTPVQREFEIPEIALALARAHQLPEDARVNFVRRPASIFQWNWDCQLMAQLGDVANMCDYISWVLDNDNIPRMDGPWNIIAVCFEGTKACMSLMNIGTTSSSRDDCASLFIGIEQLRLTCFYALSSRYKSEGILKTRPDLAQHFLNGI